jgi:hypothetical protein
MASLGKYKAEEHFDNPNNAKKDEKVQPFVNDDISEIKKKLHTIANQGNTQESRELLGNTVHTIQDFYAHSNFVEIALNEQKIPTDTMGGKTMKGDFIMTSGTFESLDTAISIAKIIADKLKEPAKKNGKLSAGTRIAIIILKNNNHELIAEKYLKVLEQKEKIKKYLIQIIPDRFQPIAEEAIKTIEESFENAKESVLNKIGDAINLMAGMLTPFTGGSDHPSHSKLAKDSDSEKRGLYPYAINLATVATQTFAEQIQKIWNLKTNNADQQQIDHELKILDNILTEYLGHPVDTKWWRNHLNPSQNPSKVSFESPKSQKPKSDSHTGSLITSKASVWLVENPKQYKTTIKAKLKKETPLKLLDQGQSQSFNQTDEKYQWWYVEAITESGILQGWVMKSCLTTSLD